MCFIQVKCYNCGALFDLYFDSESSTMCPHCLAEMPKKPFKKIRNALFTAEEVNKDFRVAHDDRDDPLFQIEIRSHYVPNNKFNQ